MCMLGLRPKSGGISKVSSIPTALFGADKASIVAGMGGVSIDRGDNSAGLQTLKQLLVRVNETRTADNVNGDQGE